MSAAGLTCSPMGPQSSPGETVVDAEDKLIAMHGAVLETTGPKDSFCPVEPSSYFESNTILYNVSLEVLHGSPRFPRISHLFLTMDGDIVTEEIIDPLLQMRTLSLERLCPEAMELTPKTPTPSLGLD